MDQPLVSIIVPVYNQEKLIKRALDSIPKRTDIEICIYNDGSTDQTKEVVFDWWWERGSECSDQIIRYSDDSVNHGLGYAKNRLYEMATGDYIHELDSDDYLYTDKYEFVMGELDGTDVVYIDMLTYEGRRFHLTPESRRGFCGGPCRFYRREFIQGIQCREIRSGEDWYFNEEVLAKNPTEKFTGCIAYHYNFPREGSLYDQMIKGEL